VDVDGDGGIADAATETVTLGVTLDGSGSGTVTSMPEGIDCGSTCSASFPKSSVITLTATAAPGSTFIGWSGACEGLLPCAPELDGDTSVTATFGLSGSTLWLKQIESTGEDSGLDVRVAPDGGVIVVGVFGGPIVIDGTPLDPAGTPGSTDILVMKLSPLDGHLVWAKRFGGPDLEIPMAMDVDDAGDVYLTGIFRDTVPFGAFPLTSSGFTDMFAVKLSGSDGTPLWAKRFGGASNLELADAIAVDALGDATITGYFNGTSSFDDIFLIATGGQNAFIIKCDGTDGHRVWTRALGGDSGVADGNGVATDSTGNVIVSGSYSGTVDFGGFPPLTSQAGSMDVFVAKYASADGARLFSISFGDVLSDAGGKVVVDSSDAMIVTGDIEGTIDFGGGHVTTASGMFLTKFTTAGAPVWSIGVDGPVVAGLSTDPSNNLFMTGSFAGSVDFGGTLLSSAGADDGFMARFNASSEHAWSRRFGGTAAELVTGIDADSTIVVSTGGFRGFSEFGDETLTSAGGSDMYIVAVVP
jgi:hypothetical protein